MRFFDRFNAEKQKTTKIVGVNELAATSAGDAKPRIGTHSLSSCLGIAAYDRERRIGGVAHILLMLSPPFLAPVKAGIFSLISETDKLGGNVYSIYAFNARHGMRLWNEQLCDFLEAFIKLMAATGRVSGFAYNDARNFILNTRNGRIES
jgi:hypothetical protein